MGFVQEWAPFDDAIQLAGSLAHFIARKPTDLNIWAAEIVIMAKV